MKLEFRYRFEAAHRFIQSESKPCMTPHGHTWYATMGLSFCGQQLDSSEMTVEFSKAKKKWKILIQETFDHSYMHNINDPIVEVLLKQKVSPRLIPFPGDPTTEMIALFLFNKMEKILRIEKWADRIQLDSIRLEETPTNSITCDRDFYLRSMNHYRSFDGWWNQTDLSSRTFYGK